MITTSKSSEIVLFRDEASAAYPIAAPFNPDTAYPEYVFGEVGEKNAAYAAVRETFRLLGLDAKHFGSKAWNPLDEVVRPGDKVVIKPNFVRESPYKGGDQDALITHGSMIRAMVDYVLIALDGKGEIVIGDAPIQTADWGKILAVSGVDKLVEWYRSKTEVKVNLLDFRTEKTDKTYGSFVWRHRTLGGPDDWIVVDMGENSFLDAPEVKQDRLRAPNYDRHLMAEHHQKGKHEYLINRHVLEADALIVMPKLKTHRIGGLTCAMKNLVGILAHKSCLAHYSAGSTDEGGDEYPEASLTKRIFSWLIEQEDAAKLFLKRLILFFPRTVFHFLTRRGDKIFEGSWHQNDTLWRMVIDLNKIVLFADKKGKLQVEQQRRYFCLVDGLVAGEKNGPLMPANKPVGVIVAGYNPVAIDTVCARLMGFDIERIPTIAKAYGKQPFRLAEFESREIITVPEKRIPNLHFIPHKNWLGKVEGALDA